MSVYNHQDLVADAIDSILNQTLREIELVIINDGSTDGSLDVIQQYAKIDPRVVVINQDNNGLTKSLNKGIKRSTGKYIARQDADDISYSNRLETQLSILKKYELDVLTSRAFKDGAIVPSSLLLRFNKESILQAGNIFIHGTFFADRKVFDLIGYDERYRYAQDFKFMLNVCSNGYKFGYMLTPTYRLGSFDESISNTRTKEQSKSASNAILEYFSGNKIYLRIEKTGFSERFKKISKMAYILYLYFGKNGRKFKVIRSD